MEKVDEDASLEFKWLKKRSVGGKTKRIQFYDSFIYDGVKYVLYDCVYMYKEGLREPYIGKLTKIWEHWDKTKKVKVQWFFRPEEISKWLGETKTLENEILFASGEGVGLANINPLEAIAGKCNVVCVSKDCRNPQPSDEELKAADFIFYRTFDVQSCTILDKMDEKVGGLEIQYIFNRKEGENTNTAPGSTSDRKEENQNTTFCSEAQQLLTKSLPNKLKDHKDDVKLSVKVDAEGESQGKDIPSLLAERTSLAVIEPSFESGVDSKKVDKANSEMGETDASIFEAHKDNSKLKDMPFSKDKAEKDEIEAIIVPVHKVEAKKRNKPPTGSDKLRDRPSKKIKSDNKKPPVEKQVEPEVARDSERLKDMPSKKAKVDNSIKLPVDSNSKHEDKLSLHVNNLKASGTSGTNSELDKTDSCIVEAGKDNSKLMDMACNNADKDEIEVSIGPVRKVETKEKKRTPMGSDKLHDRPLKKIKPDDKTTPKEKQVELEVAGDPERLKDVPSKKSKVDNSIKLPVDSKSKHEEKLTPHVNNLKALGTSGTTEEKPHQKNGKVLLGSAKGKSSAKVTDDLEDGILKKTRADDSLKYSDHKKNNSVQKPSLNTNGSNSKDLVAPSVSSEGKSDHGLASGSLGTNKDPKVEQSGESKKKPSMSNPGTNKESKVEQSGESKRKLSMSKLSKASSLSMDRDKKTMYQEFVVGPKPNADKSGWFRRLPWEERLKNAYDQGSAIMLHNVDPNYTSGEVEDIIWHAFKENSEAKILQRTAVSSPHYGQALILLKTKEAAQRVLAKLDEECLMLSNGRPLVGTTCPPISSRKNTIFFGHLAIDKIRLQNQREMDEAVSTSHFSQPNTIEYDMAMEWSLLQSRSEKWWEMIHKQQGLELRKLQTALTRK